jgi:hypothetical protein
MIRTVLSLASIVRDVKNTPCIAKQSSLAISCSDYLVAVLQDGHQIEDQVSTI